jgi:hypothetical protein
MTAPFFSTLAATFVATFGGLAVAGFGAALLFAPSTPPPRFISDTFEFNLAPGWACDLEDTDYVCWKGKPPHDAIAIITRKRRGSDDNLDAYEEHLRTPRTRQDGAQSRIRIVRRRPLAGYEWVEGVHEGSEVPNYITFYLATATSQVGVLATFSFHRDYERMGRLEMEVMMSSLKIHQRGL